MKYNNAFIALLLILIPCHYGVSKTLYIYHDADYSVNIDSANAMKMGFLTALSEVDNKVHGYNIKLIEKNHRGNINRSLSTFKHFKKNANALFILGGLHSPPYIVNREYINKNKIPLLVPWAAGGPITRYPDSNNWVFRLSIDDTVAGNRLAEHALSKLHCKSPRLFLEQTPWGESNYKTMSAYLNNKVPFDVSWFGWNTKQNTAEVEIKKAINQNVDCLILVASYTESVHFLNAMLAISPELRLPIISHWGLTGGDLDKVLTPELKKGVDLSVIQSCFAFNDDWITPFSEKVLKRAKTLFPAAFTNKDMLNAPAGFIHAYDLGRIAIRALQNIKLSGDIKKDRLAFKNALENIQHPIQGLIKQYEKPFSIWTQSKPDAHEALNLADFCMATFDDKNQIKVLKN